MERILIGFIFGLVFGSFIDCIANRSFTKISFLGRSFCDHCKKTLPWYTLIPVFSYLFLKGKCQYCKKKFSAESTLVEIITGLLTAFILFSAVPAEIFNLQWEAKLLITLDVAFKLFAIYIFSIVFITDIKSGLIPDRITYPAILITAGYLLFNTGLKIGLLFLSLKNSELGQYLLPPHSDYFYRHVLDFAEMVGWNFASGVGVGLFFLILILVTKGRGMGGGDMKLGVFIGLVLGLPNSVAAIMIAFLLGSIFGIVLIVSRIKKFGQTIPFGPFLSLASILTLIWGDKIVNWYLNFRLL